MTTRPGTDRHSTDRHSGQVPLDRLLGQVERLVSRRLDSVLAAENLTVDQWRVIDLLADDEGHTMSGIAAGVAVPGPTLTKIVDRLVDSATVYRLVDARDRRRVLAFLSDHGHVVHARLSPRAAAVESDVLATLGADAPALLDLLARLAAQR